MEDKNIFRGKGLGERIVKDRKTARKLVTGESDVCGESEEVET